MPDWTNSAAAKIEPGDIMNLVVLGMVVLLSLIGGAFQKALQKAERKRAQQEAEARRRQQAAPGTAPPPPPRQRPPVPDEQLARQVRRVMGLPEASARRPERAQARPAPPPTAEAAQTPAGPEQPLMTPAMAGKSTVEPRPARARVVELLSRDDARKAIIHQQILSPPKALQQGPEMWDL